MAQLPAAWRDWAPTSGRQDGEQARMRAAVRARARVTRRAQRSAELDPPTSAKVAGLRYVNDRTDARIRRVGPSHVCATCCPTAARCRSSGTAADPQPRRFRPPGPTSGSARYPNGHLQATGRDARGRKQYRYHARWREVRDEVKYGRLIAFAAALPRDPAAHQTPTCSRPGLPREKVLAAVVQLLEKTLIRVGNEEYARAERLRSA